MAQGREKRLTCWQCGSYDREARRCRVGKANPKKKHESFTVAELLGPQALCIHNPFREPLLLRMHHPKQRFLWTIPETKLSREPVEVEILDEKE